MLRISRCGSAVSFAESGYSRLTAVRFVGGFVIVQPFQLNPVRSNVTMRWILRLFLYRQSLHISNIGKKHVFSISRLMIMLWAKLLSPFWVNYYAGIGGAEKQTLSEVICQTPLALKR